MSTLLNKKKALESYGGGIPLGISMERHENDCHWVAIAQHAADVEGLPSVDEMQKVIVARGYTAGTRASARDIAELIHGLCIKKLKGE